MVKDYQLPMLRQLLLRIMNDKTQCEYNESAFECIATKEPFYRAC
jgi:hypothetical protein